MKQKKNFIVGSKNHNEEDECYKECKKEKKK